MKLFPGLVLALLFSSYPLSADTWLDLSEAMKSSKTQLNLRYRYEYVDQDGFDEEARASTLRGRLSWTSGAIGDWTAIVEADYVAVIGTEDYNSTENGKTEFPVVADPEGFDLNQALLKYSGDSADVSLGRQRIVHADQRFVGGVAWRQNEQTYDAARITYKAFEDVTIDYSYVWNVNRIFGPDDGAQPADWRSDSHFLTAKIGVSEGHTIEGFVYLLDFENDNGPPNSNATYGVSYRGSFAPLSIAATYATQSDYGDSPLDYDADFYALELGLSLKPVKLTAGIQVLGSDDGTAGFRTPLATLHKWQGFADKFLGTPPAGVEDIYVGLTGKLGPVNLAATYHDFSSDEGSLDYGDELNLVATWKAHEHLTVQAKFADYSADDFATDTTKVWLSLIVSL